MSRYGYGAKASEIDYSEEIAGYLRFLARNKMNKELLGALKKHAKTIQQEQLNETLYVAAQAGNLVAMEALIKAGADVNADAFGIHRTPITEAASNNNKKAVALLKKYGADINLPNLGEGNTPLMRAAYDSVIMEDEASRLQRMRNLIAHGADVNARNETGNTALMRAVYGNFTEGAKLLIEKGADVTIANSDGTTALHEAASQGNIEMMKLLLEKGADINAISTEYRTNGGSVLAALFQASYNTHRYPEFTPDVFREAVKFYFDKGGKSNGIDISSLCDEDLYNNKEIIDLLLQNGATITQDCYLLWAAQDNNTEAVQFLIDHGLNVNAVDNGQTILQGAAKWNAVESVKILLENGADVNYVRRRNILDYTLESTILEDLIPNATATQRDMIALLAVQDYSKLSEKNPERYERQSYLIQQWIEASPENAAAYNRAKDEVARATHETPQNDAAPEQNTAQPAHGETTPQPTQGENLLSSLRARSGSSGIPAEQTANTPQRELA